MRQELCLIRSLRWLCLETGRLSWLLTLILLAPQPAEFEQSEISQFFDFEFTSLPNFVYERQRFEEGVQELAVR